MRKTGFTLVELIIVMAIISILTGLLIANFIGVRERGRDSQRKSDLRQIQSALEFYRSDNDGYPVNVPNCGSSLKAPPVPACSSTIVYLQNVSQDPQGGSYQYSVAGSGLGYCLRACLENTNDPDRDEVKFGSDNPSISGCSLSACAAGRKSLTLENP